MQHKMKSNGVRILLVFLRDVIWISALFGNAAAGDASCAQEYSAPSRLRRQVYPEIKCRVCNYNSMTCCWDSPENVSYSLKHNDDPKERFKDCPHTEEQHHRRCCELRPFGLYEHYMILVSDDGERQSPVEHWLKTDIFAVVQLDSVVTLRIYSVTSRSISLEWREPYESAHLYSHLRGAEVSFCYWINVTSESTGTNISLPPSNNRTILWNVTSLQPSTNYSIAVEAITCVNYINGPRDVWNITGFWSQPSVIVGLTLPDVPEQAPKVTPGGFYLTKNGVDNVVIIYWQEVPRSHSNGRIVGSRVRYRTVKKSNLLYTTHSVLQTNSTFGKSETISGWEWSETTSESNCAMLRLSSKLDYEVVVNSKTSVGFNDSLTLDSIKIQSFDEFHPLFAIQKKLDLVALRNGSQINMHWSSVLNATGYTTYCCGGTVLDNDGNCSDALIWKSAEANATMTSAPCDVTALDTRGPTLGLSVEFTDARNDTVSSGIAWSPCIHDLSADVEEPKNFHLDVSGHDTLSIRWRVAAACEESGYISHYIVEYWQSDKPGMQAVNKTTASTACTSSGECTFSLFKLLPGETYTVRVKSWSKFGESNFTTPITGRTRIRAEPAKEKTIYIKIGVILSVVLMMLLALLIICRYWNKKVSIAMPNGTTTLPLDVIDAGYNSASSSAPTVSNISNDDVMVTPPHSPGIAVDDATLVASHSPGVVSSNPLCSLHATYDCSSQTTYDSSAQTMYDSSTQSMISSEATEMQQQTGQGQASRIAVGAVAYTPAVFVTQSFG